MSTIAQIPSQSEAISDRAGHGRLWHPRPHICAVCTYRTRGFGWFNPCTSRHPRIPRWFCSMQCQTLFAAKARKGLSMVEFTQEEIQALPAVMRALAVEMERIGWDRPLAHLTQDDMHQLIMTTVEAFRAEMSSIVAETDEVPF